MGVRAVTGSGKVLLKETLTLDPRRRTTWRNRKEKKTGKGASEYGKLNNVILDSFRVEEAESFPSRNTLQTNMSGQVELGRGFQQALDLEVRSTEVLVKWGAWLNLPKEKA